MMGMEKLPFSNNEEYAILRANKLGGNHGSEATAATRGAYVA